VGLLITPGIVFEGVRSCREVSGDRGAEGRYDNLISQLSDGVLSLPALGFAMGDVVLGELINEIPPAREGMQESSSKR